MLARYRVGLPGWKLAHRLGVPLTLRVNVHFDPEVKSFWTSSPDLNGLVVTGESLDEVWKEVEIGIGELLELELGVVPERALPTLRMIGAACAA